MRPNESVTVLGVRVDLLDVRGVRARLVNALADPWDGCCRHVVTLNPEYVMAARRNSPFHAALDRAEVATADGVGVAVVARWLAGGLKVPARVTGVDIVEWLAEGSGGGSPLFLLGGGPGVAQDAAAALERRFGRSVVAGFWDGGTSRPEDDEPALARIRVSGARTVLVAYGAPGQVLWIDRNQAGLAAAGVRVAVGVGGAMDYLAGRVPRAPAPLRRMGLEWLYRLVREPWRWRRQLVLPQFALLAILEWLWRRGNRAGRYIRRMEPSDSAAAPRPESKDTASPNDQRKSLQGTARQEGETPGRSPHSVEPVSRAESEK